MKYIQCMNHGLPVIRQDEGAEEERGEETEGKQYSKR